MSLDADVIVDRRRMRRKLTFWRVSRCADRRLRRSAAPPSLLAPGSWLLPGGDYIARIRIQGLIRDNQDRVEALERLGKSHAKAVIVHIDSPGGTTAGSEQLYDALHAPAGEEADGGGGGRARRFRRLYRRALLPTTSSRRTRRWSARSACCSSIRISPTCSRRSASRSRRSSRRRSRPRPTASSRPARRRAPRSRRSWSNSYAWFKGLVKDRRQMDDAQLAAVADGRVFTGRQGVALKLVDEPRQRKDRDGLAREGKEGPGRHAGARLFAAAAIQRLSFLHVAAWTFEAVGLSAVAHRIEEWGAVQAVERLNLDGLLALWHPPSSN